ncbi:hypothetical protein H7H51_07725 [Mycolicibacterium farcinogenes]|nr:hypothetical protein [Mycolicibacterium farcinogenes]
MSSTNDFTVQYAICLPDGEFFRHPMNGEICMWSTRQNAEHVLDQLRAHAKAMGVPEYAGFLARRYCTPFVPLDQELAEQMIDELTQWLHTNGGAS